jgi:hypothetical protein
MSIIWNLNIRIEQKNIKISLVDRGLKQKGEIVLE